MRINIYSQELTDEVKEIQKTGDNGELFKGAQLILYSSDRLPDRPWDDRSAVTFWLPRSEHRRKLMAKAFMEIAEIFLIEPNK